MLAAEREVRQPPRSGGQGKRRGHNPIEYNCLMDNNRWGYASILIVVLVAIALLIIGSLYYRSHTPKLETSSPQPAAVVDDGVPSATTSSGSSSGEVFRNQPGAIVAPIGRADQGYVLSVNLLSGNPQWIPGGSDNHGGFFIDQNPKVRNLVATPATKAYRCDGANPTRSVDISEFIPVIQNIIIKSQTDAGLVGEFGYTAYFDIKGTTITALYEQCLP